MLEAIDELISDGIRELRAARTEEGLLLANGGLDKLEKLKGWITKENPAAPAQ